MSDLPHYGLLQQLNAKAVSGEHLEVLGKKASSLWCEGRAKTLNDAVVATVKHAGLSPEQVKRVIEFANTEAYLTQFRKEGTASKVVDFGPGGPASPAVVLQDLNDGGGGSVFDPGTGDYNQPPAEKTSSARDKTASAAEDALLFEAFGVRETALPLAEPMANTIELRDKLASAFEQATAQLSTLENMFSDLRDRTFHNVKQAALSGTALSEVAEIWNRFAPSETYVKVAFRAIIPQLIENGVFANGEAVAESLQKVAHVGIPNEEHPLVADFKDLCEVLSKLAETREIQQATGEGLIEVNEVLKHAGKEGLLPQGLNLLQRAANKAGHGGAVLGEKLLGEGKGKALGTIAKGMVYAAPAIGAHEIYRRTLKHNPMFQGAKQTVLGAIPGTPEYNRKELELQMAAQGYGGMGGY